MLIAIAVSGISVQMIQFVCDMKPTRADRVAACRVYQYS